MIRFLAVLLLGPGILYLSILLPFIAAALLGVISITLYDRLGEWVWLLAAIYFVTLISLYIRTRR